MKQPWAALLLFSCAALGQTQSSAPAAQPSTAAPVAPVRNFATVSASTRTPLDSKSCASGKEFRSAITSSFVFSGEQVESGAELVGHIQACNRDASGKLSTAVVAVDSLALPDHSLVPIESVLQALGEPVTPRSIPLEDEGNRFDSTLWTAIAPPWSPHRSDVYTAATKGPSGAGILDNTSTGVTGLKHITFENAAAGSGMVWVFTSDNGTLEIKRESQMIVRFRIPSHPIHP